jgi:aspartate/glutamate racemase
VQSPDHVAHPVAHRHLDPSDPVYGLDHGEPERAIRRQPIDQLDRERGQVHASHTNPCASWPVTDIEPVERAERWEEAGACLAAHGGPVRAQRLHTVGLLATAYTIEQDFLAVELALGSR